MWSQIRTTDHVTGGRCLVLVAPPHGPESKGFMWWPFIEITVAESKIPVEVYYGRLLGGTIFLNFTSKFFVP
jgi:hypothetical protein